MDPDKTLEGILVQLSAKETMVEFVKVFEMAIEFIGESDKENKQALEEQVRSSLEEAFNKLSTNNSAEWARIKAKVELLRNGEDYVLTDYDRKEIAASIPVPIVEKITEKTEIIHEQPIVKEVAVGDTPDEVVEKINRSNSFISQERIAGLVDAVRNMVANASVGITTSFFNGLRAKNLTINGATATQRGDTVFITVSGSGGGQVNSVVAGTGISVDSTDPVNPIVSATGTFNVLLPTAGIVNGVNTVFTFASAPKIIVLDNANMMNKQNITPDLTQNWTGTTMITLQVAPNFNIYGL